MKIAGTAPVALLSAFLALGLGEAIAKSDHGDGKGQGGQHQGRDHASVGERHGKDGQHAADPVDSAGLEDAETNDDGRNGTMADPVDSAEPEDVETDDDAHGGTASSASVTDGEAHDGGVDHDNLQQGDQTGPDDGRTGRAYILVR